MAMKEEKKAKKERKRLKKERKEKKQARRDESVEEEPVLEQDDHDDGNNDYDASHDLREKDKSDPKGEATDEADDQDEEDGDTKKKRRRKRKRSKKSQDPETEDPAEATPAASDSHGDDETARTLFVEGVPYDATAEEVAECLQLHVKIDRSDITDLRFATWQDSGRLRGYGHVVLSTAEQCQKVLQFAASQKMWLHKRYLSLQQARPKGLGGALQDSSSSISEPSNTIMIKNLAYEATEEDIEQVMQQFGTIVDGGVRIARNFQTRQNKGFAYVDYADLGSAKNAMEHYQKSISDTNKMLSILNRPCRLDYDSGRIKGSFKTSTGRLWSREHKESHQSHQHKKQRP